MLSAVLTWEFAVHSVRMADLKPGPTAQVFPLALAPTAPVLRRRAGRTSLPSIGPHKSSSSVSVHRRRKDMARPARRPLAVTAPTVHDLSEEFLASCKAKDLSDRTVE